MKEPPALFVQCSSNFSLIGKWLLIDLHFRKPPSNAPITRAVKSTKTHLLPLQFDGVPIPITGTFPMLITSHTTFSPSDEPHAGHQCPTTGQRGGGMSDRARVEIWRFVFVLNLCAPESGH